MLAAGPVAHFTSRERIMQSLFPGSKDIRMAQAAGIRTHICRLDRGNSEKGAAYNTLLQGIDQGDLNLRQAGCCYWNGYSPRCLVIPL